MEGTQEEEGRLQYGSKLELMLTLVGYAVGLGNIWRFPYLTYSYGGGAFLIPYLVALLALGLPLFVLELGLGQMLRQGTMGIWAKLGVPRLRGVGAAATITTFLVSLYYNVILAWTIYYLGRTLGALFSEGTLPWDDQMRGFQCPPSFLAAREEVANSPYIINQATGLYNKSHIQDFWCPETGVPSVSSEIAAGYVRATATPLSCPAVAAVEFWEKQALQQSSGMDDLGGFNGGLLLAYTVAWILVYICIFKGIASSGKVVYVTATLPYVALIAFFVRAITLPNAVSGIKFYLEPDFSLLLDGTVWMRAVTQIFYSLGVGFGSLIAFASYGSKNSDFVCDAVKVSLINCGTSVFAGFVVFPILGYLALELSEINPCINADDLGDLASIGLSGTGLAFIAFPIAISQMPGGFAWAILFFVMLLCLGIDSEFAMVESVMTVLYDAGWGSKMPRPMFAALICVVSYIIGLIFVTRGGIYWFQLFDYYTCVVSMFFVTAIECCGLMWYRRGTWVSFRERVKENTGRGLGCCFMLSWRLVCPLLLAILTVLSLTTWDLMDAANSVPYPEGTGYLPGWSVWLGWLLGMLPILGFVFFLVLKVPQESKDLETSDGFEAEDERRDFVSCSQPPPADNWSKDAMSPPLDAVVLGKGALSPADIDLKIDREVQTDLPPKPTAAKGASTRCPSREKAQQPKVEDIDAVPIFGWLCGIFTKRLNTPGA